MAWVRPRRTAMAGATENGVSWRPASDGPGAKWTTLPSGQVELRLIDVTEGAGKQWLFRTGRWDRFRRGNLDLHKITLIRPPHDTERD